MNLEPFYIGVNKVFLIIFLAVIIYLFVRVKLPEAIRTMLIMGFTVLFVIYFFNASVYTQQGPKQSTNEEIDLFSNYFGP